MLAKYRSILANGILDVNLSLKVWCCIIDTEIFDSDFQLFFFHI
jgi:hypothetical protein